MPQTTNYPTRPRRRPNYRLRRIVALILLLLILGGIITGCVAGCHQIQRLLGGKTTGYPVETPREYTAEERSARLTELAEAYPEFQAVAKHPEDYPDAMLNALCNNPSMLDFVKGYPQADGSVTGGLTKSECKEAFPLFLQWDARWGYVPFGDDNIGLSGCGPTCMAMAAFALTRDEHITPDQTAAAAAEGGYYEAGVGTSWSFFTEGAAQFGVTGEVLSLDQGTILDQLEQGHPIICSMGPGDFTAHGHFILLVGTENGKIRVNDPNSPERSEKLWEYETIADQVKNLWVYTAA